MSSSPVSPTFTNFSASSPYSSASSVADFDVEHDMSSSYPYPPATVYQQAQQSDGGYHHETVEQENMYSAYPMPWTVPQARKQQVATHQYTNSHSSSSPLAAYTPSEQHQTTPLHSPIPQQLSHPQSQPQVHNGDYEEWQRNTNTYPQSVPAQQPYRVKVEEIPDAYSNQLFDRPTYVVPSQHHQVSQQQPSVYTNFDYQNSTQQHHAHERYLAELSHAKSLSPLRVEYSHSHSPQPGCDPRYVSGNIESVPTLHGDEPPLIRMEDDVDADGEDDKGEDVYDQHSHRRDSYEDDEDDDEYEDFDDARDGDFVLRHGRSIARRNTNTRSTSFEHYSRSSYPGSSAYSQHGGVTTRARRTVSSSSAYPSSIHGARYRARPAASLQTPIPVPNLTKKSRGRRVPTVDVDADYRSGQGARIHKCEVAECGKCFARGEHLKRHVRSIHTYEKPHKCPYPGCGKDFSRHDNLGQHMRVHKDYCG